jgi:hypothetical protein
MVKESQILLCDGPGCNGEVCFDCAGLKRVPTGNYYCYLCDPPEAPSNQESVAQQQLDIPPEEPTTERAMERAMERAVEEHFEESMEEPTA